MGKRNLIRDLVWELIWGSAILAMLAMIGWGFTLFSFSMMNNDYQITFLDRIRQFFGW
jgi:hypothetical protein